MGKIISIANQKGGVGKTTTAIHLGAALAMAKKLVLVVDFDSQGNLTTGLGKRKKSNFGSGALYSTMKVCEKELHFCEGEKFYLLPRGLAFRPERAFFGGKERAQLKENLELLKERFDFILIDCPPSMGPLIEDALCVADSILIPVQCEFFAMEGLSRILTEARRVRGNEDPAFFLEGVLITMYEKGVGFSFEVTQEIQEHFKDKTFLTSIPRDASFSEASSYGQSLFRYNIFSKGARGYIELAREVI